ncbi:MAG: glycosyltransferase family 4 protein [Spirochaetales bacterium]|nr:glycosyltransferase family 4 protein [Spirochaetales bacterium]
MVIAGNSFLAEWFSRFCKRVEILPTAVDTNRFHPATRESTQPAVIGWSGTSVNFRFLQELEPALRKVLQERPDARLAICADRPPNFLSLPMDRVDFIPWSPAIEVSFIQSLAIGLMPLTDGEWARGKCSYKMLLYLACGVPAVVSPVGMNQEILAAGSVGLAASDEREWVSAMVDLLDDAADRRCRGENGRRLVVEKFSVDVVARHLSEFLKQAAAGSYGSNGSCVA